MQVIVAVILPLAFGSLCGLLLGESRLWYLIISTAGILGGISAGAEHLGWREGFVRGLAGGALFSLALVGVHLLRGVPTLGDLPASLGASGVIFTLVSAPFGALGGLLRCCTTGTPADAAT